MYSIISRGTWDYETDELVHENVGYTTDQVLRDAINDQANAGIGLWTVMNKIGLETGAVTLKDFFQDNPVAHMCTIETSDVTGLPEITDINDL